MNSWIYYTVKRLYKIKKLPSKKDLVFKLLDKAQKDLKGIIYSISEQDRMINCEGYGPWSIKGNKTHHKRMLPVYRGYKKTYLKQKQNVENAISILKNIFRKEYN